MGYYERNMVDEEGIQESRLLMSQQAEGDAMPTLEELAPPTRPPTEWVGPTPNRTPKPVVAPRRIAIHSMAGFWAGSINWNKNPSVGASAHFYIRSSDGHIGQLVSEREQAWGSFFYWHPKTHEVVPEPYRGFHFFHIEHEDLLRANIDDDWITEALLDSSARLVAYLCATYSIPIDRDHILGHKEIPVADHGDPGPFWPWSHYMDLVRHYANVEPPFELKKYNLVHTSRWGVERAEFLAREGNARSDKVLFAAAGGSDAVEYAGREAALNQPAGSLVTVVVGEKAKAALEANGKGALEVSSQPGGKAISDVWDGGSALRLFYCVKEIQDREPSLSETDWAKVYVDEYLGGHWPGGGEPSAPNSLVGKPLATKEQCLDFAERNDAPPHVREWVDLDWIWGEATGIRPDILFAQEMLETNFGKFTGKVPPDYHNVAGIKIKNPSPDDLPQDHERFPGWSEGIRAHANHLCAYVGLEPVEGPKGEPVHDRYFVVAALPWAGTVKTIEGLSGRYAPRMDYHVLLRDSFLKPMGAWV